MRRVIACLLAGFLMLPGLVAGCAGDGDSASYSPVGPRTSESVDYGAGGYRNGPAVNNTTDPGADRALDRGAMESGTMNGARDGGMGWGVSGGSPVGR